MEGQKRIGAGQRGVRITKYRNFTEDKYLLLQDVLVLCYNKRKTLAVASTPRKEITMTNLDLAFAEITRIEHTVEFLMKDPSFIRDYEWEVAHGYETRSLRECAEAAVAENA